MTFGEEGKNGARVHDLKDVEAILDVFQAHGHSEVNIVALWHYRKSILSRITTRLILLSHIVAALVKNT